MQCPAEKPKFKLPAHLDKTRPSISRTLYVRIGGSALHQYERPIQC